MSGENDYFLGKLAIERKLLTAEELQAAVDEQSRNPGTPLSEILLAMELVGAKEIGALRRELQKTDGPTLENTPSGAVEKTRLACGACKAEFLLAGFNPAKVYNCTKCKGSLAPKAELKKAGLTGPISDSKLPPDLKPELRTKARSFGKYILLDELGRGGMGVVYRAWEHAARRYVAVKCMLKADDPTEVKRFQREARTSSGLQHENIVGVYDVGDQDETMYIAMEYVEGQPFSRHLNPRNPADKRMPLKEALAIIRDSARALDCAHEAGIVHRDVKPQNVMVSKSGEAKVMDFGLAREMKRGATVTTEGTVMGTPYYMSPEQTRGKPEFVDHRTDIWALGVMIYEVATKELPFDADRPVEILHLIDTTEPVSPRKKNPRMDVDLETITMKCLERETERRYKTAAELAEDIDRYLTKKPIVARPPSAFYKLRKRLAKRKGVAWATVGGLAAVIAVVAFLLPKLGSAQKKATEAGAAAETAHKATLEQLKQTTETALAAALGFRQMGKLEETKKYVQQTEEACQRAMKDIPDAPEPYFRLGRMYRATMQFDKALAQQEEALKRDPVNSPARYERGLLLIRQYDEAIARLREDWKRHEAESIGGKAGKATIREPERRDLEEAQTKQLKQKALEDLGGLNQKVARALVLWLDYQPNSRALFEEAAKESPDVEEIWEWLGRISLEALKPDEAVQWYTKGHERDRGYLPYLEGRAWARFILGCGKEWEGKPGDPFFEATITDLDEAIRLDPSRVQSWTVRGRARGFWGNAKADRGEDPTSMYELALTDFGEAVRIDPRSVDGWARKGGARLSLAQHKGDHGEEASSLFGAAIADLDESVRLSPTSEESWKSRGHARDGFGLYLKGRGKDPTEFYLAAIEDLGQAIRLNPANDGNWLYRGDTRINLAIYRESRGEDPSDFYRAAIQDYDEALRLRPRRDRSWSGRATAKLNWGSYVDEHGQDPSDMYRQAIADFDQATQLNPGRDETWVARGTVRLNWAQSRERKGEDPSDLYESGIADFSEAARLNPKRATTWMSRGQLHMNLGIYQQGKGADPSKLYEESISDFGEAVKINPRDSDSLMRRGKSRLAWGQYLHLRGEDPSELYKSSLEDLNQSIGINASNGDSWQVRGHVYYNRVITAQRRGLDVEPDLKAALDNFTEALRLNPKLERTVGPMVAAIRRALGQD